MASFVRGVWSSVVVGFFCSFLRFYSPIDAFNVDVDLPIVKNGDRNAYFGFSVAEHFIRNQLRNINDPWILVGAPKANVTDATTPPHVQRVSSPGAVYKCPFSSYSNDCTLVRIDHSDDSSRFSDKSDQWLGVAVASQGTGEGKAVACAHRYKKSGASFRWGLGFCISMTNDLEEDEYYDPCGGKPTDKGHEQYGLCQAGASVVISKDGDLVIGAPGPFNWRGAIFKNIVQSSLADDGQWLSSPVEDSIPGVPGPEPAVGFYSYLGLSVKVGYIINGRKTYIAGAPRSKGSGQVLLFEPGRDYLRVEAKHYLTGEQFGSCFGYDVAVADFNSDGKQDLVIGAPFYYGVGVGGAIYIYLNGPQGITEATKYLRITSRKMKEAECLKLDCQNARFGFVLASIGDINRDGYEDLAVGAPYEGDGAVYIFHGSPSGLKTDFSQRIYASDLPSASPLKTFGYSMSGGEDLDFNGYPDLVVGSFDAGKVVILRSRPVINVNASFSNAPKKINPNHKTCLLDSRKNNCFELVLCFKYTAEPKERFAGPVDLEYRVEAEKVTGAKIVRVFFKGAPNEDDFFIERKSVLQAQNIEQCISQIVYVKHNNLDFLSAIQFRLTYKLRKVHPPTMIPGSPPPDINAYPVLDEAAAEIPLAVHFLKNCAHDTECLSNLNVSASFDSLERDVFGDYVLRIGQTEDIKLEVVVGNSEEEAHETMLFVTLPPSLLYIGLDERGKPYACSQSKNVVACAIANPLHSGEQAKFGIRLDPKNVHSTMQKLNISLLVNTTSTEKNQLNDMMIIKVKVIIEADIEVRGKSNPKEVFFGGVVRGASAMKNELEIGSEIIHSYEVKNLGGGVVDNSTLIIHWPYEMERGQPEGKTLLYLMERPKLEGEIECFPEEKYINRFNITAIESDLLKKNTLLESDTNKARIQRHIKRSVDDVQTERLEDGRIITVVYLDCERRSSKCRNMSCNIKELYAGQSVVVHMRFRLWHSTFLEDYTSVDRVLLSSKAEIKIDPKLNIQQGNTRNDVFMTTTIVQPSQEIQVAPEVELWIIIVAVCIGLLLFILLIILLWKCGFFVRKKPDEMAEHKAKLETQKDFPE